MRAAAFTILSLLVFGLMVTNQMSAHESKTCAPDYDLSSIKNVTIDENADYVFNEIEIIVDMPIDKYYKWNRHDTSLEEILPGVTTRALNDINRWEEGHRRIICNPDGTTVVEEIIKVIPEKCFIYKIWNFSNEFMAERVEYAKGEFWYTPMGNKTHIRWRYSFKLSNEVYRQEFGSFVKNVWNNWMITTLNRMKKLAEEAIK